MNEMQKNTTGVRAFSTDEINQAKNMLVILAHISAEYWAKALMSEYFVPGGKLHDYTIGYKHRITKIVADPNVPAITFEQISTFKEEFLNLSNEEISNYLSDDHCIGVLLDKSERYHENYRCNDFSFGGWDNDPIGTVAKAMHKANIHGKMNGGYTKTRITLLDDGTIRVGWFKWCPVLTTVR